VQKTVPYQCINVHDYRGDKGEARCFQSIAPEKIKNQMLYIAKYDVYIGTGTRCGDFEGCFSFQFYYDNLWTH
jgi:hypothetical protein